MASASDRTSKNGGARPITAYPLFPAFVAVWFAALFGLSSLAVGLPNLERAVAALQLQDLIPAAAPPLGMTGRALIALALALAGAVVGFVIAHGLVRARRRAGQRVVDRTARDAALSVRARDLHPDAPVRRPISAHEELGDADVADEAAALDMESLRASLAAARDEPVADDVALPSFLASAEPEEPAAPVAQARPLPPAPFDLPAGEAAARIASADLESLSPVELLERMAIAMQRRLDRRSQAAAEENGAQPGESIAIFPARTSAPTPAVPPGADGDGEADETEKALRQALTALQRMTGTA